MNLSELTDREIDARVAEKIMELVPCAAESHKPGADPYVAGPCHARPDSPAHGGETQLYSSDMVSAMEVRDAVKTWIFSERRKFKLALQILVSKRLEMSGLVHEEEIILHFTAKDICLAALSARNGDEIL